MTTEASNAVVFDSIERERDTYLETLIDYLRIPSI
jgi:hypothetical protein